MERLDIIHHKIILLIIILGTLLTGIFFGVQLAGATRGTEGMSIIIFSLCFLMTAVLFIMLMMLVHIRDELRCATGPAKNEAGAKKKR